MPSKASSRKKKGNAMTQKQKSLVGGVSILGLAGLICKVVGVLYRIPLAHIIDPMGIAIYHKVFPAYNLLLTISSAGIPVAISRMVSHYVTKDQPGNAKKIFQTALYLLCALGLLTTLLLMLFSGNVAAWQGTQEAAAGYLCIAPSLFFVCAMSAYRGYMQGTRHMLPTRRMRKRRSPQGCGFFSSTVVLGRSFKICMVCSFRDVRTTAALTE